MSTHVAPALQPRSVAPSVSSVGHSSGAHTAIRPAPAPILSIVVLRDTDAARPQCQLPVAWRPRIPRRVTSCGWSRSAKLHSSATPPQTDSSMSTDEG